jgi:hypothetical protein
MSPVGFEPMIQVFELAKTFHALDRTATVTGSLFLHTPFITEQENEGRYELRI